MLSTTTFRVIDSRLAKPNPQRSWQSFPKAQCAVRKMNIHPLRNENDS
jgi:hypothetical protein